MGAFDTYKSEIQVMTERLERMSEQIKNRTYLGYKVVDLKQGAADALWGSAQHESRRFEGYKLAIQHLQDISRCRSWKDISFNVAEALSGIRRAWSELVLHLKDSLEDAHCWLEFGGVHEEFHDINGNKVVIQKEKHRTAHPTIYIWVNKWHCKTGSITEGFAEMLLTKTFDEDDSASYPKPCEVKVFETSEEVARLSNEIEYLQNQGRYEELRCMLRDRPVQETKPEPEEELEQAIKATAYIEEDAEVDAMLLAEDLASLEQEAKQETKTTTETLTETVETPASTVSTCSSQRYYVEVVLGTCWYCIAYTAGLGYYWSTDKKDAHGFTLEEAKEYQATSTHSGLSFIQVLDEVEAVVETVAETAMILSVPEPETVVETQVETQVTLETATDSQMQLIPIRHAVWELTSMAYDKQKTHKDMLNRLQWHRYDFYELGGAVAKLWGELIDKVYNASRRCRAVAIMAKYQVLLQTELETMGIPMSSNVAAVEA